MTFLSFVMTTGKHGGAEICGYYVALGPQVACKSEREIRCPATNIKHTRLRWELTERHGLVAPTVMETKTQHSIQCVIMSCNGSKHMLHGFSHSFCAFFLGQFPCFWIGDAILWGAEPIHATPLSSEPYRWFASRYLAEAHFVSQSQ